MDKFYQWLSFKLPRRLVYFCTIRLGAETTTGRFSGTIVPEVPLLTCLKRWEKSE